jgi:hypothetical protein
MVVAVEFDAQVARGDARRHRVEQWQRLGLLRLNFANSDRLCFPA